MDASEEFYVSQRDLIVQRAKEHNVNQVQLHLFFDNKIREIARSYPNTSAAWRLARVEYLAWERFFPNEPFPGILEKKPIKVAPATTNMFQTKPTDPTKTEWVHDKYNPDLQSRPEFVERGLYEQSQQTSRYAVRAGDYYTPDNRRKMNRKYGDHYSPSPRRQDSQIKITPPNSQQKMIPEEITSYYTANRTFFRSKSTDSTAKIKENTNRNRPMNYTQSAITPALNMETKLILPQVQMSVFPLRPETSKTPSALGLDSKLVTPQISNQANLMWANMGASLPLSQNKSPIQADCSPIMRYRSQEHIMEHLARVGGFRAKMFSCLQDARAFVKNVHSDCHRYVRGYLADKLTWEHFWKDEFPGIEPLGCHSSRCLARSEKSSCNAPFRPTSAPTAKRDPLLAFPGQGLRPEEKTLEERLPSVSPAVLESLSAPKKVKEGPGDRPTKLGTVSSGPMDPITNSSTTGIPLRPAGQSSSLVPEGTINTLIDRLSSQISHPVSTTSAGFPLASRSATTSLGGNPKEITTVAPSKTDDSQNDTPSPSHTPSQAFQDPDEMWKMFRTRFQYSDWERSYFETTVMTQGKLRLVFDEPSGQMVTLDELIKRIQYRCTLETKITSKRKADENDIEGARAQKRAVRFLDSLNN